MAHPRVLIVSHTIPENRMGGGILLHRHFRLRSSFDIAVITNNESALNDSTVSFVGEPGIVKRMKHTRFHRWAHDYSHVVLPKLFDRQLLALANAFQPDLVFNVAESYFSQQALSLSRLLGVPFACYFMDWGNYATNAHGWVTPIIDRSFRKLYRDADLAFCISEGMREELGPHRNSHVVPPISGSEDLLISRDRSESDRFTFFFAGNLARWYGDMVATVLESVEDDPVVRLCVYGSHHNWPEEFVLRQKELGNYLGFRQYEELKREMAAADAFLLPVGFDDSVELIERTSFKTKLLDYLPFGRPIVIWGPESCSAIRVAREHDAALCVTDPDPRAAVEAMRRIASDESLRVDLGRGATELYKGVLHPEAIHATFRNALVELAECGPQSSSVGEGGER